MEVKKRNTKKRKALIIYSGGLDSTVCLQIAMKSYDIVECIIFDYNQINKTEIKKAKLLLKKLRIKYSIKKINYIKNNPKKEIYLRNDLFITLAASEAISKNFTTLIYGASPGDVSRDSTEPFITYKKQILRLFDIELDAPLYRYFDRSKIWSIFLKQFKPTDIHSCQSKKICGKCRTCIRNYHSLKQIYMVSNLKEYISFMTNG